MPVKNKSKSYSGSVPRNFELAKYKLVSQHNELDWFLELSVREVILRSIANGDFGVETTKSIIDSLLDDPIVVKTPKNDLGDRERRPVFLLNLILIVMRNIDNLGAKNEGLAAKQINFFDLMEFNAMLEITEPGLNSIQLRHLEQLAGISAYNPVFTPIFKVPDYASNSIDGLMGDDFTECIVSIDMQKSTEDISSAIKKIVRAKRRQNSKRQLKTPAPRVIDVNNLIKFGLLPFLDLYIWSLYHEVYQLDYKPITYVDFSQLIFPEDNNEDENTVRLTTVNKYVTRLISGSLLDNLARQINKKDLNTWG